MKLLLLVSMIIAAQVSFSQNLSEENYFKFKTMKVTEIADKLPSDYMQIYQAEDCSQQNNLKLNQVSSFTEVSVLIDQIVNLGQKIWPLVEQGKPVVSYKIHSANALPKGLNCWNELTNWNIPNSKLFRVQYENYLGMTVVDFAYRVSFISGGQYKGQGKYIALAQVAPAEINVSWGFNLDALAEAPQVFNHGTQENPVSGLLLTIKWKVVTPLDYNENIKMYHVTGENNIYTLQ